MVSDVTSSTRACSAAHASFEEGGKDAGGTTHHRTCVVLEGGEGEGGGGRGEGGGGRHIKFHTLDHV